MKNILLEKVKQHLGHDLTVASYVTPNGNILNYSIECNDCYEVIEDWDVDENGNELVNERE